ncbi:MAG: alanine--glyoxylate aminotransferase family protein [Deltaproteobacteria bacterium]|nr:alanine--glyoxylate aminotransferase family protein [Deltaproteobacteria bacterium]MCZ6549294.1 alanine--glyoxylate aminotransferase family protein [Deltaproteobacteria bacterium]MCZ6561847.1 alanine--glyoxylate aminotransferase family protein [Deltaproteobacteria bacterium]
MIKKYLLTPGPTPIPDEVRSAMADATVHHRTPQFSKIFTEVREGLKILFGTVCDVLVLAASGTGAMEAAVTNLFSPGEKVLVINGGKFGERWLRICRSFGLQVVEIKVEWGKAVKIETIKENLHDHPDIQGVLIQASETSTTALHPIRDIAKITRTGPLLLVDGVTAVGVLPVAMDEWGIDVLVTGSQKALMVPPGLGFISLSDRAWARTEKAKLPRFYFDLALERKSQAKGTTAFTPAISLILGLRAALKKILEEGPDRVYARHERLARATRAAATALGLGLLAPENPSPAVTGIFVPKNMDADQLLDYLRDRMGIIFAEGQDQLRGKIIRIAHVGYMGAFDVIVAVSALEMGLKRLGFPVKFGQGIAAAQEVLMEALDEGLKEKS